MKNQVFTQFIKSKYIIMENTELVKQYIDALDVSLDEIEPIIKEISSKSFEDRINETSDEHEKIKISNSYAYLLTSLSFG